MNIRKYSIHITGTTLAEPKPLINAFKGMGEPLFNGVLFAEGLPVHNLLYDSTKWLVSSSSRPTLTIPQAIDMLIPHRFKEL